MPYIGSDVNAQSLFVNGGDQFSGNGSNKIFTLSRPVGSVYDCQVTVNDTIQNPFSAYTVVNNTLTFTNAPTTGTNNIQVIYRASVQTTALSAGLSLNLANSSETTPSINFVSSNTTGLYCNNQSTIGFTIGGSSKLSVDFNGSLYVNTTTTPSSSNTGFAVLKAGSGTYVYNATSSAISYPHVTFINPNGTVGSITTNGSATAYVTSSDYRLKKNIKPMQDALAVVKKLNPVTYKWKADDSSSQGFIAHELQKVVPECVIGKKDEVDENGNPLYQGIDTSFLIATLTKSIQELSDKVDLLESKLNGTV